MNRNKGIYKNILELVGQTPMVQLNNITKTLPGKYFAKLEMFNPGQSQKDRIALHIIENAERKGILKLLLYVLVYLEYSGLGRQSRVNLYCTIS